jgi:hypothetical protein
MQVERPQKPPEGFLEGLKRSIEMWLREGVCDPFFAGISYRER